MSHAHHHEHHNGPFPKVVLWGAACLVGVSIFAAFTGAPGVESRRMTRMMVEARQAEAAVTATASDAASRETALREATALRFADAPDGGIIVTEDGDAAPLLIIEPGDGGFIRGVMRGLIRERRARGVTTNPAFQLGHAENGQLTLLDPATGAAVDLRAFGRDNEQAFARLLSTPGDRG